ncbi:hypothetical protein [Belliella pelovolcani]|uniref:hypothetical protein n=1 Tax=Belliella pelovolcani TaxID=529505 RepID=UPI00391D9D07
MITTYNQSHWVLIKVYDKQGGNLLQLHRWDEMRFETRNKWGWYFIYRAALAQVQHPKAHVDFTWGNIQALGKTKTQLLSNKITARKRKITEYKNKLSKFEEEFEIYKSAYIKIFPIEEETEYQMYINSIALAQSKIKRLETELTQLQKEVGDDK